MAFFDRFTSCTAAGSGNQNWAALEEGCLQRGRVYFRLSRDVERCALLYSGRMDSTYADGSRSRAEMEMDPWRIHALRVGRIDRGTGEDCADPEAFTAVLFGGKTEKTVGPGETCETDPFALKAKKGDTICIEMAFSGRSVPCHTESLVPAFRFLSGVWQQSTDLPFPSMVGAERGAEKRLGLLGDSITQGIGTPFNSYTHLAARLQEALGDGCAVWNLGLGYGRASDAALDGSWLCKARENDVVCVCFGVNDLLQTGDENRLTQDLWTVLRALRESGVKTVLETVPPFDWGEALRPKWERVNALLREGGKERADAVLDTVPLLGLSPEEPWRARFGGHPDERGNARWAEGLLPLVKDLLGR